MTLRVAVLFVASSALARAASAQATPHADDQTAVAGAVTVTTKGMSTIPSFTLGKPAAIFDVSIAKHGLSFEPQFKFGLDGKPWAITFWGRYRLFDGEKLHVGIGGHPALSFKTIPVTASGTTRDVIVARRYLAGELAPSYSLTRNLSVGPYYLYSHGMQSDAARNTHFVSARATLSNIAVSDNLFLRFAPQVYYLKSDDTDGYYLNSALILASRDLPFAISTTANKPLRTNVLGGEEFIWNVSLHYALR
jgi:hypothetical protein